MSEKISLDSSDMVYNSNNQIHAIILYTKKNTYDSSWLSFG